MRAKERQTDSKWEKDSLSIHWSGRRQRGILLTKLSLVTHSTVEGAIRKEWGFFGEYNKLRLKPERVSMHLNTDSQSPWNLIWGMEHYSLILLSWWRWWRWTNDLRSGPFQGRGKRSTSFWLSTSSSRNSEHLGRMDRGPSNQKTSVS